MHKVARVLPSCVEYVMRTFVALFICVRAFQCAPFLIKIPAESDDTTCCATWKISTNKISLHSIDAGKKFEKKNDFSPKNDSSGKLLLKMQQMITFKGVGDGEVSDIWILAKNKTYIRLLRFCAVMFMSAGNNKVSSISTISTSPDWISAAPSHEIIIGMQSAPVEQFSGVWNDKKRKFIFIKKMLKFIWFCSLSAAAQMTSIDVSEIHKVHRAAAAQSNLPFVWKGNFQTQNCVRTKFTMKVHQSYGGYWARTFTCIVIWSISNDNIFPFYNFFFLLLGISNKYFLSRSLPVLCSLQS